MGPSPRLGGMSPQEVALRGAWLGSTGRFGMPQPHANGMPVPVRPGAAFWLQAPSPRRDTDQAGRWGPLWEAGPILSPSPHPGAQYPDVKEPLEVSV